MAETSGSEPTYDIPKMCKAAVVEDEGPNFKIKLIEVPTPEPGPDQVLIKLNTTGLCYSDLHFMLNDLGMPKMTSLGVHSPGHEGAGVIVKLGSGVRSLKVGQRAGLKPIWDTCGACELCYHDKEVHCTGAIFTGLAATGSYQQYIVSPQRYTTLIPAGVPDDVAGPVMCSASTMYRAISNSGLKIGQWACFPGGAGGVGSQGVQIAKALGYRVVVVDTSEAKRKHALEKLGAEAFVDFKEVEDTGKEVTKICDGIGAHGVFVTAPSAYKTAISLTGTRPAATVVCVGLATPGLGDLGADGTIMALRGLTIKGSLVGSMYDTHMALDLARRGKLQSITEEILPFNRLPEGVDRLRNSKVAGRLVVDFNA